jgi:anion-transporting  ArsA/GET3 family ATPase
MRDAGTEGGLAALMSDKLVFVTGKGGTGKSTVAAALGRVMAARGRRTLVCEVDAQRPALEPIFGVRPTLQPVTVAERLDVANLTWPDVLGAYLRRMVRLGWVVDGVLSNERIRRFLDFTPGAQDLVEVSAIDDFCAQYDAVVVDMPASGHAFSLLDVTRSALQLFRAGPVRQRATELRARIGDPSTTLVFVALPEDMVVNETLETWQRMHDAKLVGGEPFVVLNRCTAPTLASEESILLDRLSAEAGLGAQAEALLAAGRWERGQEWAAGSAIERLTAGTGRPPVVIPPLVAGSAPREVAGKVAAHLGRMVGLSRQEVTWT